MTSYDELVAEPIFFLHYESLVCPITTISASKEPQETCFRHTMVIFSEKLLKITVLVDENLPKIDHGAQHKNPKNE